MNKQGVYSGMRAKIAKSIDIMSDSQKAKYYWKAKPV